MDQESLVQIKQIVTEASQGLRQEMQEGLTGVRQEITTSGADLRRETQEGLTGLRQEITTSGNSLRQEMATMAGELRQEIATSTADLRGEITAAATGLRGEITASADETKRHSGVLSEDLQHKLELVIEGQQDIRQELRNVHLKIDHESSDIRALLRASYQELRQRVEGLEARS